MSLDVTTVAAFSQGRLDQDDAETARQLAAAVAAARNYCGWHVTPVISGQQVILDGPGTYLLSLPTLKLTALTTVVENDIELNLNDLNWSARGLIQRRDGHYWTTLFGAISVTFSHGYASAPDFESAVLSSIARGAFSTDTGPRVIGPFTYSEITPAGALFTDAERAILDKYALERRA
ncbi:MAG: hypothetical protein WD072_03410 [Pirellulales bacterium]